MAAISVTLDYGSLAAIGLFALSALILSAARAAGKSPVEYLFARRLHRDKIDVEYEYEQRKELRARIGQFHGRLVEAASAMNYRLLNLEKNRKRYIEEGWLRREKAPLRLLRRRRYDGYGYYYRTTVARFLMLAALSNKFEHEALFIDSRIAEPTDRTFLFYVKAFGWAMTDVELFRGLTYNSSESTDHFFTDELRRICMNVSKDDPSLDPRSFHELFMGDSDFASAISFFDDLRPGQLRWDRLMALQLLLMAFLNRFGYPDIHMSDESWFEKVASQIHHRAVAENLSAWMPRLGLKDDEEARRIDAALKRRITLPDAV